MQASIPLAKTALCHLGMASILPACSSIHPALTSMKGDDGKDTVFHGGIINLSQLLKLEGNYGMTLNGGRLRGEALFVLCLF